MPIFFSNVQFNNTKNREKVIGKATEAWLQKKQTNKKSRPAVTGM